VAKKEDLREKWGEEKKGKRAKASNSWVEVKKVWKGKYTLPALRKWYSRRLSGEQSKIKGGRLTGASTGGTGLE